MADVQDADRVGEDDKKVDAQPKDDKKDTTVSEDYARRLRREAQQEREAREKAEREAAELRKFKEERERKDLEEQKEYEKLAKHERDLREKAEREASEKLAAADSRTKKTALRALARAAGMYDLDDVRHIDLDKLTLDDDGELVGGDEAIAKLREVKPHYFKPVDEKKTDKKDEKKTTRTPQPSDKAPADEDVYSLSNEEFEKRYAQLGRV